MRELEQIKHDIALVGLEIAKAKPAIDHYNHLLIMKSDLEKELFDWKINNGEYHSITELPHDEHKIPITMELVMRINGKITTKLLIDHMRLDNNGYLTYQFDGKKLYHDPDSYDPHDYIKEYGKNSIKIRVLGYLKVEYVGG